MQEFFSSVTLKPSCTVPRKSTMHLPPFRSAGKEQNPDTDVTEGKEARRSRRSYTIYHMVLPARHM